MNGDVWDHIGVLTGWLDDTTAAKMRWWWFPARRRAFRQHELSLRIAKCGEEAGEAIAARIGVVGQNPRKGRTHNDADVANELTDVAVTAMVALATLTGDPALAREHLAARVDVLIGRIPGPQRTSRQR